MIRVGIARRCFADERGASLVEFALVAPVFLMILVAGFDFAHTAYLRAALQGVVEKTARDSSLEDNAGATNQATLDARVTNQVRAIAGNATIAISRRYYRTFSTAAAAVPETWTDTNKNGTCDGSEPYEDANNNSTWDADGGNAGQGGAKDKTVYTVRVTYPRLLPLYNFIKIDRDVDVVAKTVLANQPYGDQGTDGPATTRNCPAAVVASATPKPTPTPTPAPSATPIPAAAAGACRMKYMGVCLY